MNNYDIAHSFFYSGFNDELDKSYKTMGYKNNLFYSYYTVIGAVIKDKNNNNVLLYSENSMTPTTGRHISYLHRACPFQAIAMPFSYGMHVWSIDTTINNIYKNINYYVTSNLNQKQNRQKLINAYNQLSWLLDNINLNKENTKKIKSYLKQFKEYFEIVTDTQKQYTKRAEKLTFEKNKKQAQKEKRFLNNILKKYTYHDMVYNLFNNKFNIDDTRILKQYLHTKEYSYIWLDNDNKTIKTSQYISMDVDKIMPLIKLYKKNKLKHGMACDRYTILSITNDYIKIGCHVIPIKNINSLINKIESIGA